jgi:protein O-mannosyl-transferase
MRGSTKASFFIYQNQIHFLKKYIYREKIVAYNLNSQKKSNNTIAQSIKHNILMWQLFIPPLIIIFSCIAVYFSSVHYAFQFDDLPNILKFYEIRHLTFKDLYFSSSRWIIRWLNTFYYSMGKFDPFFYRVGNIIFHTLSSILVFFITWSLLHKLKEKNFLSIHAFSIATVTSLLFALHPVHTQTVSYVIQGQSEGLASLCMLAIISFFLLFCFQKNKIIRICSLGGLFATAILSCGTKEIAIVSPALVLLIDWFFIAQGSRKSFKSRLLLHLFLGLIICGTYFYFLKPQFFANILSLQTHAVNNFGNKISENYVAGKILPTDFLISQFKVVLHYAIIFIWPFYISTDYDWKLVPSFWDFDSLVPFVILLTIFLIIINRLRKNSTDILSFCFFWFMILILPRSSIIPSSELVADYKTYLASVSILLLLGTALVYIAMRITYFARDIFAHFQPIMLCLFVLPLGYTTFTRNKVWSSGEAFWSDVIKRSPKKARAYNNYGVALCESNKYTDAIEYFKKAITLDKNYPDPWFNMAAAYNYLGNIDQAIACAQESILICPYLPEAYLNLGCFLVDKKHYQEAVVPLKKALELRPHYGKAHYNLGRVYMGLDKKQDAYESLKKACLAGDFDNALGFYSYGSICLDLKKYSEAIPALQKAYELAPHMHEIVLNLAHAYFLHKQYSPAIPLYQQLVQKQPEDPKLWFNLGECYALLSYYKEAIACYNRAFNIQNMPVILIRLAACYERLGNIQQARTILHDLIAQNPPMELKREAQQALTHLSQVK